MNRSAPGRWQAHLLNPVHWLLRCVHLTLCVYTHTHRCYNRQDAMSRHQCVHHCLWPHHDSVHTREGAGSLHTGPRVSGHTGTVQLGCALSLVIGHPYAQAISLRVSCAGLITMHPVCVRVCVCVGTRLTVRLSMETQTL